jgi:hypothetical protein
MPQQTNLKHKSKKNPEVKLRKTKVAAKVAMKEVMKNDFNNREFFKF